MWQCASKKADVAHQSRNYVGILCTSIAFYVVRRGLQMTLRHAASSSPMLWHWLLNGKMGWLLDGRTGSSICGHRKPRQYFLDKKLLSKKYWMIFKHLKHILSYEKKNCHFHLYLAGLWGSKKVRARGARQNFFLKNFSFRCISETL